MISLPVIRIFPRRIGQNAQHLRALCQLRGIEVVGVTKVTLGDPIVATEMLNAGMRILGESRLANVELLRRSGINHHMVLLRAPESIEIPRAVELVDTFLVSELGPMRVIQNAAEEKGRRCSFVYMVDTGDLREGVYHKNALQELSKAAKLAGDSLSGIGTNLGCYGGVIATPEKFEILVRIGREIEKKTGQKIRIYSAGNTASLPLVEGKTVPEGVNQFRLGESIICGTDVTNNRDVPGTRQDTFIMAAEIIELKTKPSVPEGLIGQDAFGRKPVFTDKGKQLRAILNVGEQDTYSGGMIPLDQGAEVLHASSDHLIVDVSRCERSLKVGQTMEFRLSYGALLRAMTSPFVEKVYEHSS